MSRITDKLTADVAMHIVNEHINKIISLHNKEPNKRFITVVYPSENVLDTRIKSINTQVPFLIYEVIFLNTDEIPSNKHIKAFPSIKVAINDKSLICFSIATVQNDTNIITHSVSSFKLQ